MLIISRTNSIGGFGDKVHMISDGTTTIGYVSMVNGTQMVHFTAPIALTLIPLVAAEIKKHFNMVRRDDR